MPSLLKQMAGDCRGLLIWCEMTTMTQTKTKDNGERSRTDRLLIGRLVSLLPDAGAHFIFWSLMTGGLFLDLWTKKAAFDRLDPGEILPVISGFMQLVRAENNGAAADFSGADQEETVVYTPAEDGWLGLLVWKNDENSATVSVGSEGAGQPVQQVFLPLILVP